MGIMYIIERALLWVLNLIFMRHVTNRIMYIMFLREPNQQFKLLLHFDLSHLTVTVLNPTGIHHIQLMVFRHVHVVSQAKTNRLGRIACQK